MIDCSVLVGSYGDPWWAELAASRAIPSTTRQGAREVLVAHDLGGARHTVRNRLAEQAAGEWLCFLDADDRLAAGYLTAMGRCERSGGFELLNPAIANADEPELAGCLPAKDIRFGNYLVVGTLVQRERFLELGGFRDWNARTGNEFDDWDLWIRCHLAGASVVQVPEAVYLIGSTVRSRAAAADEETAGRWVREIGECYFPELYAEPVEGAA